MQIGDLIYANVLDRRLFDAQGENGSPGIYSTAIPGRPMPFVLFRSYKVPAGFVSEEIRFTGPSGRLVWRRGPIATRMGGGMEQTRLLDDVSDALLDEQGTYLVSFIIDGEILGEIEVPVILAAAETNLPKEIEEGLKKSDIIWIGSDQRPKGVQEWEDNRVVPIWFAYRSGKIYVLSQKQQGPEEQTIHGIETMQQLQVVTRRKGRDTSLDRFHANVRLLETGPEFDEAAKVLVDRRRSRTGPPAESLSRWKTSCVIAELTPVL